MEFSQLPLFDDVDLIQVGARNMQNFELLKELGHIKKPILLKRGLANTIQELLMSVEYIMAGGNENVILCNPQHALCDGAQSLTPQVFDDVAKSCFALRPYAYKG